MKKQGKREIIVLPGVEKLEERITPDELQNRGNSNLIFKVILLTLLILVIILKLK